MNNRLTFDSDKCKGCELCVFACPRNILVLDVSSMNPSGYNPAYCFNIEECTACAMCAKICPDSVIKVERGVPEENVAEETEEYESEETQKLAGV